MKRRKKGALIVFSMVALLSATLYWYYFSEPDLFPTTEQLINEINSMNPEAVATEIQDILYADDRHALVPFISENNDYGLSYWVWKRNQWRLDKTDSKGTPMVWKVVPSNPSSYQFVWNFHPVDQVSSVDFYLIRKRGYGVTEEVEHYYPGIQLKKNVPLKKKTFGMEPLPEEWVTVMTSLDKVQCTQQNSDLWFNDIFPMQEMYIGWLPYDQTNVQTYPERSVNGVGYSNGHEIVDFLMILDKSEVEVPE